MANSQADGLLIFLVLGLFLSYFVIYFAVLNAIRASRQPVKQRD